MYAYKYSILTVLLLPLVGTSCADNFALPSADDTRLDTL